jgi:hypothetical protein
MTRGGPRPGAGRPKVTDAPDPKRAIPVKLEASLIAKARAIGGTVAEGIRIALRSYTQPPEDPRKHGN